MSLPNQNEAYIQTTANISAFTATANANFIANATNLINNATNLGFFAVAPLLTPYLSIPTITEYFQSYGYTVYSPPCPNWSYPWENYGPFQWNWNNCGCTVPCRVFITWTSSPTEYYFGLEDGGFIELENGLGIIELEY